MRTPAALAAVPLLVGCAAGLLIWPTLDQLPAAGPAGAALALLAAAALTAEDDVHAASAAIVAGFLLAGAALGWLAADRAYAPPLLRWHEDLTRSEPVVVEGALREDARISGQGISLTLDVERVDGQPIAGGVRLTVAGALAPTAAGQWRRGRRIRAPVFLRTPSSFGTPGVPDETRSLARRGICLVGSVKSAALVECVSRASLVDEAAARLRAWSRQRLVTAIERWSARSAAIAIAILIGDRTQLPQADERRLQDAGTYHVIAISGGNIAILTVLLVLGARMTGLPWPAGAALAIAVLLFYARLTGSPPSVARAVTAAVVFLGARVFDHRGAALNALAVAAVIAVAASPAAVLDPGLILSFGATVAILVGTPLMLAASPDPPVTMMGRWRRRVTGAVGAVLAATVCAELALGPIAASLFGRVTFAGLLLNLIAIPLMTVVQLASLGVLLLYDTWPAAADVCAWTTHAAATGLVESARLVEIAPWLSLRASPPAVPILLGYYTSLLFLLSPHHRWWARAAVSALGLVIVAGPHGIARDDVGPPRGELRVVVLDVGQGDSTLVAMGRRHALLVDAGGVASYSTEPDPENTSFDVGERVVVPALRALGVFRLDGLVLTHGDPDHILGAPAALGSFVPRTIWEGVPVPRHALLQAVRRGADEIGLAWRTVQTGDREAFGAVEVRVLHPPPPDWERQKVRNEDSVVLEVRLGNVSIVLAGDVGREGERALLRHLERGRLTILKAGHHGSATSSTPEFVEALRPAAVVFSAGRDNRFGHPHPDVVRRFEAIGSAIFSTDRDGTVMVETDGRRVTVETFYGRMAVFALSELRTKTRRHDVATPD